nr:hypothetical protein [uncultured Hyphomonas sp.]
MGIGLVLTVRRIGWGKAVLVIWLGLFTFLAGVSVRTISEEKHHLASLRKADAAAYKEYVEVHATDSRVRAALKEVDAAEYENLLNQEAATAAEQQRLRDDQQLAEVLQKSPHMWLAKLQELRPVEYQQVMTDRAARIADLDKEVRAIPAADLEKNLDLYRQLVALDPKNERYVSKYLDYEHKVGVREWQLAACTTGYPEDEAGQNAKELVKQTLKAPSTAKFPFILRGEYKGDCQFVVRSWVDAQNGFGAQVRTYYTVTMIRSKSGWHLVSMEIS